MQRFSIVVDGKKIPCKWTTPFNHSLLTAISNLGGSPPEATNLDVIIWSKIKSVILGDRNELYYTMRFKLEQPTEITRPYIGVIDEAYAVVSKYLWDSFASRHRDWREVDWKKEGF